MRGAPCYGGRGSQAPLTPPQATREARTWPARAPLSRPRTGATARLGAALALAFALALLPGTRVQGADAADPRDASAGLAWITEEYYPFNYREDGVVRGISADLLRLAWAELGEPEQSIFILPWARAYKQAMGTSGMVLFSTARTPEREALFKWAGPIAQVRFVLAAPRGSGVRVGRPEDLAGLRVGTLRDDVSDSLLAPWRSVCRVESVADMDQNLRKLDAGRIDLVAYEEASLRLLLRRQGRDPDAYETVYVLKETPVYYAFHISTDDELVRRFQRALDDAKDSEAYARLLDTYLR